MPSSPTPPRSTEEVARAHALELARGPRPPLALARLAAAMRELTETLLRVEQLPEDLSAETEALRDRLAALGEALAPHAADDRAPRFGPGSTSRRPYYVEGPRVGEHHPAWIPYEIQHEGDTTHGRVRFGVTHEGPPGGVHGGIVAHFFDQVLSAHNLALGIPAMTGSLTVRYRRPTPILTPLTFRVRSVREGTRKVRTTGLLLEGEDVVAEGDGLFVVPQRPPSLPEAGPPAADDAPLG